MFCFVVNLLHMLKMVTYRTSSLMLRGVLCKEVVLALVFKRMHYLHPSAAEWCMTKCHLKNKDENDEKPDETVVFCNSSFRI